jgi:hypothetical protein
LIASKEEEEEEKENGAMGVSLYVSQAQMPERSGEHEHVPSRF